MKSEFYYQKERFGECHFNSFVNFKEIKGTRESEDPRTSKFSPGLGGGQNGYSWYSYFSSTCIFGA